MGWGHLPWADTSEAACPPVTSWSGLELGPSLKSQLCRLLIGHGTMGKSQNIPKYLPSPENENFANYIKPAYKSHRIIYPKSGSLRGPEK